MPQFDLAAIAREIAPVIRQYVESAMDKFRKAIFADFGALIEQSDARCKSLEGEIEALKQVVSELRGICADDRAAFDERCKEVSETLPKQVLEFAQGCVSDEVDRVRQALPVPQDGKSVSVDDVRPLLEQLVAEIPRPQDGKSVTVDDVRPLLEQLVAEIPRPQDGKSVAVDDVRPLLEQLVAEIPRPQDGKSVTIDDVRTLAEELVKSAVAEIPRPTDGEPGRDGLHIEVLPVIDEAKSYPRNTYATYRGGLWRSFEKTAGMRGWECIVDGLADIEFDLADSRQFRIKVMTARGVLQEKNYQLPVPKYQGIFKSGNQYSAGDMVTKAGSLWHCLTDTTDAPGQNSAWILAVKKGQDLTQSVRLS